ncbi:MAG: polyphosphate kinase 1 [Pirellulales bacterium]|nr:polyphosphate kinase 1 [Pirellulales bacterium]
MSKDPLKSPELLINRELSWLEFNRRVLEEGFDAKLPLLERLKFLAIFNSNLDEFFLVRVAWLTQRRAAKERKRDAAGMTPAEQLKAIDLRAHEMVARAAEGVRNVFAGLAKEGLRVWDRDQWTEEHRKYARLYFAREIQPVLTPLAIEELSPRPLLPNLQLHVAALLSSDNGELAQRVVVVPVPSQLDRWIAFPSESETHLARVDDVIADNLWSLFPGVEVLDTAAFRVARDADVVLQDDEEINDLLHAMEEVVLSRRRRDAVRLTVSAGAGAKLKQRLADWLELRDGQVYEIDGPQEAAALMELAQRPGFDKLKIDDWPPQVPRDLIGADDLWEAVQDRDVLLFHPYESFDPVVKLVEQAAEDPDALAIKQTLYRTSGDSPIVRALTRAAGNGKEVTVLVELKARFDEWRNVNWARRLEDAGAHVIYGVAGFKTHAKALLIVRRQGRRMVRYVHLATGNYNDRTARQYSDIGLMTCDREIAGDAASLFNLLTGCSEAVGWSKLAVAPVGLRQKFLDLIEREIQASSDDRPGLIMAKVNSLEDPEICHALYRASQAGVKVMLNVRGICCLRPGLAGVSENIEVRSIVDRYLEHARIFYFRNGGHEEVYLSSADWMKRNLSKRLELLFPISEPDHRRRLIDALRTYFADNVKSWRLLSDGTYERIVRKGKAVRVQEKFYREAIAAASEAARAAPQFRPLTRPS